jgi:rhodanese-related sulfurtransferase
MARGMSFVLAQILAQELARTLPDGRPVRVPYRFLLVHKVVVRTTEKLLCTTIRPHCASAPRRAMIDGPAWGSCFWSDRAVILWDEGPTCLIATCRRAIPMTMMDCSALETLVVNRVPIELIDVRSKREFSAMHILGAHSLPFADLAVPKIFQRRRPTIERVYVISDDHARASLATGILRSSGCVNAVVIDGGMKAWVAQGFPVLRKKFFPKVSIFLGTGAILPGMAAALALARHEILIAALLLVITAALVLKADSFARMQSRRSNKVDLTHDYKVLLTRNGSGLMEEMSL